MKIVKFLGPTHILEIEGQSIRRGKEGTVSEKTAARLKKSPQVQVEVRNLSAPRVASTPRASTGRSRTHGPAPAGAKANEKER